MIKPWIREEMEKYGIAADKAEIATVLAGLLAEKALTQQDVDTVNALRGT